jgi:hypothetical protein
MTEATIELDIVPLIGYDPLLKSLYSDLIEPELPYIKTLIIKLDIKDDDFEKFSYRFRQLMLDYKIDEKFHGYIIYIIQTVYSKRDLFSNDLVDSKQANEILKPLLSYFTLKNDVKLFNRERQKRDKIKLLVGDELEFDIPISTSFVVDAIISKLKSQTSNFYLASLFTQDNESKIVDKLFLAVKYLDFITWSPLSLPVLEVIEILNHFIGENLSKELSRKRQAFIYDLLYLFDLLINFKKKEDTSTKLRKLKRRSDWSFPPTSFEDKVQFIQKIRANYKKRLTIYTLPPKLKS